MKSLFKEYRSFFIFLGKFLLFYVVFAVLYQLYLTGNHTEIKPVDDITILVANNVDAFLQLLGEGYSSQQIQFQPHVRMYHM